jgi:hypothetical protein
MSTCIRVPFDKADGKDIFNNLDHVSYAELYTKLSNEDTHRISPAKMGQLFGPGEHRPEEHPTFQESWRFLHQGTYIRVLTRSEDAGPSAITIETPEGNNTSMGNEGIRAAVADFMATLKSALAAA